MRYGFTDGDWSAAKAEMKGILSRRARVRGMIPYSDLVSQVKAIQLAPDSRALAAMLGEISEEEDAEDRGMLTVIVVHKHGDMQPGPGFFDLAERLGRNTSDITKCWIEELKRVHAVWSK